MGWIQGLERIEQSAQRLPKTFELLSAIARGGLALVGLLVLLWAGIALGLFESGGGVKAFGFEFNWKAFNQKEPSTPGSNANYVSVGELKDDSTWVYAKCGEPNEEAVSGACTVHPDSAGWMLQGAGVQSKQTWGCLFRRTVFVKNADVPAAKEQQKGSVKLGGGELSDTLSVAAKTGRAAVRVLCAKVDRK
jgi:hypothetical protein